MKTLRSTAALAAALAFPFALTAVPQPLRLWEISVLRFTVDDNGDRWSHRGMLDTLNNFTITYTTPVLSIVTVPPAALNRNLITIDAWLAYGNLGPEAVANFSADPFGGSESFRIGERDFVPVTPHPGARFDLGDLENISARAIVTPAGEPLIGGFIIHRQARRVLIRCIGPTLAEFNVLHPLPDPYLSVYQDGAAIPHLFNDDWNQRFNAEEIKQVTAQLGAFPLPHGSKDAAYLVELEPGAYTVQLTTHGETGGTALLEIYVVP